MKKKFSIIIPAYNSEKTIERAYNSIISQTFKNYEIIIVDDCSKDNTLEVIKKLDGVIVKQTSHNSKDGGARNEGIKFATGEYIIFLDADDYLADENVLKNIDKTIGEDLPDVVYLGFRTSGKDASEEWIPNEENSTFKGRTRNWKYENVWDVCWNLKFLKENKLEFIEDKLYQDFVFYYQGILRAKSYKYASFVTHIYVIEPNKSVTSSKVDPDKVKDLYFNIGKLLEDVKYADNDKKEDFIYAIYRVSDYACRVLLQFEKETKEDK